MNPKRATTPDGNHSHAAWVACRAAMRARQNGASEVEAAEVYAVAYAVELESEKVAA